MQPALVVSRAWRCLPFRLPSTLGLLLTAVLMAGCASSPPSEPVAPPVGSRQNGVLRLTAADHSRTAELRVDERLTLSLPETPSGGRTWAIDETDRRLLSLEGSSYEEPTEGFIGARGRRTFHFEARQPGELTLSLKYWRFFEGESSITDRYAVQLRILP